MGIDVSAAPAATNASGRRNRVAPDGTAHAVAARGLYWGNRGRLLDGQGRMARHANGRNWLVCVLEFKGRQRVQWRPDRLTELYFLDEATALAAGHRPCGECRYHDYQRFKESWIRAHPGTPSGARDIDRHLHADRLDPDHAGRHRTHEVALADLPVGALIVDQGAHWLVRGAELVPWGFDGYGAAAPASSFPATVTVRTPAATVATLRAGYAPAVHPSAGVTG